MTIQQIMNNNEMNQDELLNKLKYQKYILEIKNRTDSTFQDWRETLLSAIKGLTEKRFEMYPTYPQAPRENIQDKMILAAMEDKGLMKDAFDFIYRKSMKNLKELEDFKDDVLDGLDVNNKEEKQPEPENKVVEIEVNTSAPQVNPIAKVANAVGNMFGY